MAHRSAPAGPKRSYLQSLVELPSPPQPLLSPRDGASRDVKALGSISAGRTDSMAISRDATEFALHHLQPATKYEIGVKSVRGREESELASITVYTGGKELLLGREQSNTVRLSPGQGGSPCLHLHSGD